MDSEIIARSLVTIINIIWSSSTELHRLQLLLIKRADEPLKGHWALPETPLRNEESADAACIHLVGDRIGLQTPMNSTKQLATFIDPRRVTGTRALALACTTYLLPVPKLHPGYGATDTQWLVLDRDQGNYVIIHDQQEAILSPVGHLVFDHIQIITIAINRIRNKLGYQPQILRVLGSTFTLRQTREVFAAFSGTAIDKIDNSDSRKAHNHLFEEVGVAILNHLGWPPKLY